MAKAKKKPNEQLNQQQGFDPNNPTEDDLNQMAMEQGQLDQSMQAMEQIKAIEERTKTLQQEALNKEHDADFRTQNTAMLDVIGKKEIDQAYETLKSYKEYKKELEQRLENNEKIWKMQHWDVAADNISEGTAKNERIKPKSAWLVNTILNKHADAMDNFPEANILPRAKDDEETAKQLSEIIPVVLDQNGFDKTYSDVQWYKAKNGTGVYGVFWNNDKHNGLGDIDIKKIDITRIYWKSGITDIQDSPNVFYVTMMDNDEIKARYPEVLNSNGSGDENYQFTYGEQVDTSNATAVIDWYYKRRVKTTDSNGIPKVETKVHWCKFCNGVVIYASENNPQFSQRGWYDHGKYPFVFDKLFPIEANICGMGYIDLIADDQMYIDKMQQAILENALTNARPRYLSRGDANVNEDELLDNSVSVVHVEGSLDDASFKQISVNPLSGIYETVYLQKIQEMKDTSGNTASSQGQVSSVTTASGIASLQEAAGKLSRDATSESYRAFKDVVYLVIELIRQFYTESRCFRITGDKGENEFVEFDNRGLVEDPQGMLPDGRGGEIDLGSRVPIMDIEVRTQKKSAYSKETQNQTALQLYAQGFFAPQNADASLACLSMMDFDGVEKMREIVEQNGTMFNVILQLQQQLAQLSTIVAADHPEAFSPSDVANEMQNQQINSSAASGNGGSVQPQSKGSIQTQAANNTRESTAPRS